MPQADQGEEKYFEDEKKEEQEPCLLLPALPQVDMTQVLEKLDLLTATINSYFKSLEKLINMRFYSI